MINIFAIWKDINMYNTQSGPKKEVKSEKDKTYLDRIEKLEQHVRQLSEQVNRLHADLSYNSRNLRRQSNEIENIQGFVRRR